ncbi:hypothetical protein NECAME_12975 [Necator americanus]|uniref:Uncharacterized protein n=1 Tax=Necator americanus TaxID=51031 RepID=W2SXU3_NECAM|nr:hypothetical protein NECAME_12975 [Necator americanus]ETN74455.1 hypothetical protein NECAME_12975 [Necator americanus]
MIRKGATTKEWSKIRKKPVDVLVRSAYQRRTAAFMILVLMLLLLYAETFLMLTCFKRKKPPNVRFYCLYRKSFSATHPNEFQISIVGKPAPPPAIHVETVIDEAMGGR